MKITPEEPTELDEIGIQVSFHFRTDPPRAFNFSSIIQRDAVFSVNVTVFVPKKDKAVLQVVHTDSFTYDLGKLDAGNYTFAVYVETIHGREQFILVKKVKFNVTASKTTMPEFPSNLGLLLLLMLTATSVLLVKKFAKT